MQAISGRTDGVLSTPTTAVQVVVAVPADEAADVLAAIGGRPLVVVVHDSVDVAGARRPGARTRCRGADRLMALQVFTAVTGAAWESELVGALDRADHGVTVVRRCVDVSELLAAAATGHRAGGPAVRPSCAGSTATRSPGWTPPAWPSSASSSRATTGRRSGCASSGVRRVLPADAEPEVIAQALREAVAGRSPAGAGRRRSARGAARRSGCPSEPEDRPAGPGRRRRGLGADRRARADDRRRRPRRRGGPARASPRCWSTPTSTAASSRRCWDCSTSRRAWPGRRGWPAPGALDGAGAASGWPGRCARTCAC